MCTTHYVPEQTTLHDLVTTSRTLIHTYHTASFLVYEVISFISMPPVRTTVQRQCARE